jgi:hypothetical protein
MSLQAFVWAVRTLSLIVAGAFGLLLYFLDPDTVGIYGSILFYFLGALLLFGVLYLSILGVYRIFLGDEQAVHYLGGVARQAGLLLLGIILGLIILQNDLWYWWSILLVFAFILLLEVTLRRPSKKQFSKHSDQN